MIKKITLLATVTLLLTNNQVIDTNILDGPNNEIVYGQNNQIHGRDNTVGGYDDLVVGNTNNVEGDQNDVIGNQNDIHGHGNHIEGAGDIVNGDGNIVINSAEASPEQQAMVQDAFRQRFAQILGHRQLQFYQ